MKLSLNNKLYEKVYALLDNVALDLECESNNCYVPLDSIAAESSHDLKIQLNLNQEFAEDFKNTGFTLEYQRNLELDSYLTPNQVKVTFFEHEAEKP